MEFAKQFSEAAQNAVLLAVETGSWTRFPWIENMMKQSVRDSLKGEASRDQTTSDRVRSIMPTLICGCQFGFCTCTKSYPATPDLIRTFTDPASSEGDKSVTATASSDDNGVVSIHSVSEVEKYSFESNDFTHVEGYDYRIIVTDRLKNHRNSWAEHFKQKPTQEEFEYQFRHFHARTHHVHVNHWVNGDWETITTDYVPHWNKEKPKETLKPSEEWPEGKNYRIKFWDQRITGYNYVYFAYKPGGIILNKYHSAKCFAVVQTRPEGDKSTTEENV